MRGIVLKGKTEQELGSVKDTSRDVWRRVMKKTGKY